MTITSNPPTLYIFTCPGCGVHQEQQPNGELPYYVNQGMNFNQNNKLEIFFEMIRKGNPEDAYSEESYLEDADVYVVPFGYSLYQEGRSIEKLSVEEGEKFFGKHVCVADIATPILGPQHSASSSSSEKEQKLAPPKLTQ